MQERNKFVLLAILATTATFVVLYRGGTTTTNRLRSNSRELRLFDPRSIDTKRAPQGHMIGDGLEFVHIAKTGGMAIEIAGWDAQNRNWGACHFMNWEGEKVGCNNPDWSSYKFDSWIGPSRQDSHRYVGELWHSPPSWLTPNPYLGKDTFCIIRNPYDRIVNEYEASGSALKDPRQMNEWIQLKLREVMKVTSYPGHFLPQHFYIYNHHRRRVMTHVLRYENLKQDFGELMKAYRLDIRLPPPEVLREDENSKFLAKTNLSPDTIALINNLYGADFRAFGYPMVDRPSQFVGDYNSGTNFGIVADKLSFGTLMGNEENFQQQLLQQQQPQPFVTIMDNNNNNNMNFDSTAVAANAIVDRSQTMAQQVAATEGLLQQQQQPQENLSR